MTSSTDGRQMWKLWMTYSDKKDINIFKKFLHVFNNVNEIFLSEDLPSQSTYLSEDAPHLSTLPDELLQVLNQQFQSVCDDIEKNTFNISLIDYTNDMIACLICLCKNLDNIALISSLKFILYITKITLLVLSKLCKENTEHLKPYNLLVHRTLYFFECLYDPYFIWRRKLGNLKIDVTKCKFYPALLDVEVIPFFYECFQQTPVEYDIQIRLFNLFGAILCGAVHNATKAICPATVDLVLKNLDNFSLTSLLHPEEKEARKSVLKCLIEMVHLVHGSSPDERQVEVNTILEGYFQTLSKLFREDVDDLSVISKNFTRDQSDLAADMLDTIPKMLDCCDKLSLQMLFLNCQSFDSLLILLERVTMNSSSPMCKELCIKIFYCLTQIMQSCTKAKIMFSENYCYEKINKALSFLNGGPSHKLVKALFEMSTECDLNLNIPQKIQNVRPLLMITEWIPYLPSKELQIWICESMQKLCTATTHNRMTCCNIGMISALLRLLSRPCDLDPIALDCVMMLLESLGRLSISAAELKQLISLFKTSNINRESLYIDRLIDAMSSMARRGGKEGALHYFDFQTPDAGITIPSIKRLLRSGFSFHAWVAFEQSMGYGNSDKEFGNITRYQIYSGNGSAFEAFIKMNGALMIGVQTKKEYHAVRVPYDTSLLDQQWHSLAVVHQSGRRPFSQDILHVYVDGKLKLNVPMKMPSLSEPFQHCSIGCPVQTRVFVKADQVVSDGKKINISFNPANWRFHIKKDGDNQSEVQSHRLGDEENCYGLPVSFYGQMGSVCVLNEPLSSMQIQSLYNAGPNSDTLFMADGVLSELSSKLVFYYNAKACKDEQSMDLSLNNNHGGLIGEKCITWHIKDVINCIGGVLTLFPLLEKLTYNKKPKTQYSQETRDTEENEWVMLPSDAESMNNRNSVARFFCLLKNMIRGSIVNEETLLTTGSVAILGAMMQQIPSTYIDIDVLMSLQELVECVEGSGNQRLLHHIYQHLLFDFRIWSVSEFTVRIGHIQYLSTLIKDNKKFFRKRYGVEYLLDIIRVYYEKDELSGLMINDCKQIRSALFGLIKFYILKDVNSMEIDYIFNFISIVEEEPILSELMDMILSVLETPEKRRSDQIILLLYEEGTAELLYMLVSCKLYTIELKEKILKIIDLLLKSSKVSEKSKGKLRLTDTGAYPGFISSLAGSPLSINCITMLFDLTINNAASSFNAILYLVQLVASADISIKLEITRKLLDILLSKPNAVKEIVKQLSWQEIIVQLLVCPPSSDNENILSPAWSTTSFQDLFKRSNSLTPARTEESDEEHLQPTTSYESRKSLIIPEFYLASQALAYKQGGQYLASPTEDDSDGSYLESPIVEPPLSSESFKDNIKYESKAEQDDIQDIYREFGLTLQREQLEKSEELTQNILIILLTLSMKGTEKSDDEAWKNRCQVLSAIDVASASKHILRPKDELKRRYLEIMLQTLIADMKLNEDIIVLMDLMGVWESDNEIHELVWIGLDLLMAFAGQNEHINLCAAATAKLHTLLHIRPFDKLQETCYVIGAIDSLLEKSLKNKSSSYNYFIPIMKALLEKCSEMLTISKFLTNMPDPANGPLFVEEFRTYIYSNEWRNFMSKQIDPSKKQYFANRFDELKAQMNTFKSQCHEQLMLDGHSRNKERGEGKLKFEKIVCNRWLERKRAEKRRCVNSMAQLKNQQLVTLRHWRGIKAFFTGERGAWAEPERSKIYWKLSPQENFSRMRPKLIVNYSYDAHKEASLLRDNQDVNPLPSTSLPNILKAAKVEDKDIGDDRLGDEEWNAISLGERRDSEGRQTPIGSQTQSLPPEKKEKLVLQEECELITLMDVSKGRLEVTTTHIYFYHSTSADGEESTIPGEDYKWSLSLLREIHFRRYNLRRSALEFFLIDQSNFFLNFQQKTRNKIYSKIVSLRPTNLIYHASRSPADLLKSSGLTQRWVNREISNFDYLMQLNTIAGRTYNDLSQYPIFPWILSDYSSDHLDLDNPAVYRDLSRPVGVINSKNEREVREKYENFEDLNGTIEKFHYGTHYSNSAGVMHYLIRMEPFTTLHIQLQSGKFDVSDRQFHSIPATWTAIMESPNDVKELIPEFFYLPEFLVNSNDFNLGKLQGSNEPVNDVILPNWADGPEDFIQKHRKALESEYVSQHLHEWIDLIFGFKQKGKAAVEALNVFYYCTYEGAVDLDAITDERERKAIEGMINNFGQTPCQLLKEPHPKRISKSEIINKLSSRIEKPLPISQHCSNLKTYYSEVYQPHDGLVFVCVPRNQPRKLLQQGLPDTLVTLSINGNLGVHGWLPYDKSIPNYFTFEKDPTLSTMKNKSRKTISGPFAPGLEVSPSLFIVTDDAKLLLSAGHWDNSLRVYSFSKGKTIGHHVRHTDIITCISLDRCGNHVMSGSRDTTCVIWEINQQNGVSHGINSFPLQTLYGHDAEITSVSLSIELDIAVSSSIDGSVIVHTARKGLYVRTLRPAADTAILTHLAMDYVGHLVVHCNLPANVHCNQQESQSLHCYSINGKHLIEQRLPCKVTAMLTLEDLLLVSLQNGNLIIMDLFGYKKS
ncbi:DgyrCDS11092 [Dimorphilus gyrociliatus]|uniref:DgyrCDS11092 n=1 Tax=Dimorphilus gyrociliatus TaxID=2664684 RepID=A0A7I8W463_9ANNE|nr:DgyrCDS11092 [Dimorphilus gyrociliatus]